MNFIAFLSENRNFRSLWLSQLVSALGDWISYVALSLFVIDKYADPVAALAWITVSKTVAILLFGPPGGALADVYNRKKLMVYADVLRFLLTLTLLFTPPLWALILIVFALNVLSSLFTPAYYAIVPELVEEDKLLAANSINSITGNSVWLMGTIIGGVLVTWIGYQGAFFLDALSFLVSAFFLSFINYTGHETGRITIWQPFQQTLQGIQEIKNSSPHLIIFAVTFGFFLSGGLYNFAQPLLIRKYLNLDQQYYSYALALTGAMMIFTTYLLGKYGKRLSRPFLVQIAVLLGGLSFILMGWKINLVTVMLVAAVVGISNSFGGLGMRTFLQEITPNESRGKVFGIVEPIINIALAFSALSGMVVINKLGYNFSFIFSGLFLILVYLLSLGLNRYKELNANSKQTLSA